MSVHEDSRFTFLSASCEDYRCCIGCGDEYEKVELRSGYCPGCVDILNHEAEAAEAEAEELAKAA